MTSATSLLTGGGMGFVYPLFGFRGFRPFAGDLPGGDVEAIPDIGHGDVAFRQDLPGASLGNQFCENLRGTSGSLFRIPRIPGIFLVESGNRGADMLKVSSFFVSLFFLVFSGLVSANGSRAADGQGAAGPTNAGVTGRWIINADVYGSPIFYQMHLKEGAGKLTGDFGGDKLEGTITGHAIHFVAKDDQGGTEECTATLKDGTMSGTIVFTDAGDPTHPVTNAFTGTLAPRRSTGPAKRHEFTPTVFYRQFSAANKPVLTVSPGDTVHTTTVDAGGTDEKGVKRVLGGNPETGPFYVETAMPGDTLVVKLTRLRLNRDWAISDDGIVPRGLDTEWAVKTKDNNNNVRWHLDLQRGV